jgi:hypothetical protein
MTLNLSERENEVLEGLATEMDLSKTHVLRQALRLYQAVHERGKNGERMAFVNSDGKIINHLILIG